MGDSKNYLQIDGKKEKNMGIVVIKSLIWKGFTMIYQDKNV